MKLRASVSVVQPSTLGLHGEKRPELSKLSATTISIDPRLLTSSSSYGCLCPLGLESPARLSISWLQCHTFLGENCGNTTTGSMRGIRKEGSQELRRRRRIDRGDRFRHPARNDLAARIAAFGSEID